VAERLGRLVSPAAQAFLVDACGLMAASNDLHTTSHLVGHLVREVESSMRAVLQTLVDPVKGTDDNHRQTVLLILAALEMPESDPIGRAWLEKAGTKAKGGPHKRAHRNDLVQPRPVDDDFRRYDDDFRRYWEEMQRVFDAVLDRFERHWVATHKALDRPLAKDPPARQRTAGARGTPPSGRGWPSPHGRIARRVRATSGGPLVDSPGLLLQRRENGAGPRSGDGSVTTSAAWLVPSFLLALGGCGSHPLRAPDAGAVGSPVRLIAPLSTATVTSRRPTLRWQLSGGADGAHVEICRDRGCSAPLATFDADGSSGAPAADLPPGVVFWRASARMGGMTAPATTPTWEFFVGARSALADRSSGTTPDINGDGYADLAVGAPGVDQRTGRVYLYFGGLSGLGSAPSSTLVGPDGPGGAFGQRVASAGDVNGDGFADLVVPVLSSPAADGAGRVHIYFGGPSGPALVPDVTLVGPGGGIIYFGESAASAGDVNGDGYADVIVGASDGSTVSGRAYVYLGRVSGAWGSPAATLVGAAEMNDHFGLSVAGAGDVDADGYADVVVGAFGAGGAGAAYLFLGSPSGLVTTPAVTLFDLSFAGTSLFGADVAGAGDINGDGFSDVLVRGQGESGGTNNDVFVHMGTPWPVALGTSAAVVLSQPGDAYGYFIQTGSTTAAGDVDGDGYGDIVVGNPAVNTNTGSASVYRGSAMGLIDTPAATLASPASAQGFFGNVVAGIGDVDGDGTADVVVGAFRALGDVGQVYVYRGGATAALTLAITGPDGGTGNFGASLASSY